MLLFVLPCLCVADAGALCSLAKGGREGTADSIPAHSAGMEGCGKGKDAADYEVMTV